MEKFDPAEEPLSGHNLVFLEEMYEAYMDDPQSVSDTWRMWFQALDQGRPLPSIRAAAPLTAPRSLNGSYNNPASLTTRDIGDHKDEPILDALATSAFPIPTEALRHGTGPVGGSEAVDVTKRADRISFLQGLSLFQHMPEKDVAHIADIASLQHFGPQELICREGEHGEDLYVITSGSVLIRRHQRVLVELGVGEIVGELSVLDSGPRSSDVIAHGPSELLQIKGKDFQTLLSTHSSLAQALLKVLASRVRVTSSMQERVDRLLRAYRERGHVLASIDPLERRQEFHAELTLEHYGLEESDLDLRFAARIGRDFLIQPLRQILGHLQKTYCRSIGVQYMHIDDLQLQRWLRDQLETDLHHHHLTRTQQIRILTKLTDAEVFENFLHKKYLGAKRFSLEGAESLIPLLDEAIETAGTYGVEEILIGMAHRGRLNVLANIMEKPASAIFREFEDLDPEKHAGKGDVKYHLGYSNDRQTESGSKVHLSLAFNPSHLEFVGPVVLGRTRAKQDRRNDHEHRAVLPVIIHGDAAFAGQGIVQESFNLSELPGYATGGAIHIIINNQIGFTTSPEDGRSSQYATDVARMLDVPIFHVNGEDPEAVHQVIQLALLFRDTFRKDVVIDMYCYRLHGHNEGDEPAYTQPLMYQTIKEHKTVREAYTENLLKLGEVSQAEADEIAQQSQAKLEAHLEQARAPDYKQGQKGDAPGLGLWSPYKGGPDAEVIEADTRLPESTLQDLLTRTGTMPSNFSLNRKLKRFLKRRQDMIEGSRALDWGTAELLAYASLVVEGARVRISGQDSERGTFSHRHAIVHDQENGRRYSPLQHLSPQQAPFEVYNSPLSEAAVLGFDFGYSLDYPDGLVIWEAQFGDFCNGAQVIIDQFITSSEAKWKRLNGLCMLLPHGFEGQGPEHSSARLERFLTLAADDNIQIVNLTTPAQIFHALRRQVRRPWRKPLIVMSPKSLLRHKEAVSCWSDLSEGRYQKVIADVGETDPANVDRILLCSGKVYYDLVRARKEHEKQNIAILRMEQLYPLPTTELTEALSVYKKDLPIHWVQEEPANQGAWPFLCRKLQGTMPDGRRLIGYARPESASPATGSKASHEKEQRTLLDQALNRTNNAS